ncbi:MAG: ATP-binding protein [Burkholderiales bacterium]
MAGFLLAISPLIIALVQNAVSVRKIAGMSESALYEAVLAAQNSRLLIEQVTNLERSARQYAILGNEGMLDSFDAAHNDFLETLARMRMRPLKPGIAQQQLLSDLSLRELELYSQVSLHRGAPKEVGKFADSYEALSILARSLDATGNAIVDREVRAIQGLADQVDTFIYRQMILVVPAALALLLAATFLISRPIRQIGSAIQYLGEGDFSRPVKVSGPRDLERIGKQLDWMRLRLIDLESQKTRFMHHVSHELKTPLTALREGTELLGDGTVGALSHEQNEVAVILRQNTLRLQRLIEELLNYQTVQFRKADLNLAHIALAPLLKHLGNVHALAMRAKRVSLELHCEDLLIEADEKKLETVADNLLSNAIKFSPEGGKILVSAVAVRGQLRLDVVDQGPGVPKEERLRIFEPFYQGEETARSAVKGTGLGLAIAREYVLAHGGQIEAVDHPEGAHFRITLPLERMEKAA